MAVVETVKSAVGLSDAPARESPPVQCVVVALFVESYGVFGDWEAMFANDYRETAATRAQMSEAKLPMAYRDSCANLLIPLNRCRYEEYYLPWKCETERHSYEKCQYEEFKKRVAKMDELRAAKGGARSN
ncbi:hypothetical protein V502_03391 [Pseudogymnoascus sp. VKM F-4520 (FW-2644)]|nr:hypothetical protein V502_03391 [Pseudogymnoascus sp. VKM F-4520 (FW-2644)]